MTIETNKQTNTGIKKGRKEEKIERKQIQMLDRINLISSEINFFATHFQLETKGEKYKNKVYFRTEIHNLIRMQNKFQL